MKHKIILCKQGVFFFVFIILLSSCRNKIVNINKDENNVNTIALQGINMMIDDVDFFPQKLIDLQDSILYTLNYGNDTLIGVFLVKEDSLSFVKRFLTKGIGPYEVIAFASIYDKETSTLSFFDNPGALTKGYRIDMKKKNGIDDKSTWKTFDFTKIKNIMFREGYVYVSDSLLLAIGGEYYKEELLTLINLNDGTTISPLNFWPDDGFKDNNVVKQGVYMDNAKIFKNNKLGKYLYVSALGKYMEIFSLENSQIINRLPVDKIYPRYTIAADNLNYSAEGERNRGFYVYTTDSLIYARPVEFTLEELRSGQNRDGYAIWYSNTVKVYDWQGELLKIYETDASFDSFIVDEKNSILYTLTMDVNSGDELIKKYQIPIDE